MEVCEVCGKKYNDAKASGLFTQYKGNDFEVHVHMCGQCAGLLSSMIRSFQMVKMVDEQTGKGSGEDLFGALP